MAENIEHAYELSLVLRSQIGDEAAFEELLTLHSPRLRFFMSRMLGSRHSGSEDLLQDVWLAAYRSLPRLEDAGAFRAWLFSIARARVCRELRRQRIDFQPLGDLDGSGPAIEDDADGPVDVEAVRIQVQTLAPEHREALLLRFVEDMSYEEIAQVTGTALGTVRSRIHYAKRALRRALEGK